MKKTYIIPEALVVNLSMCNIIAASGVYDEETETIETKEHVSTDGGSAGSKNVWDEEW